MHTKKHTVNRLFVSVLAPLMKDVLVDNADKCRQPDHTQHLKARNVVLLFQCQPINHTHTHTVSATHGLVVLLSNWQHVT